jgi:hypothetical protein
MTKMMTVALLALVTHTLTAPGQEQPEPADAKVSVRLSFSVEEYDPSKPSAATVRCVVRNDGDQAIEVPEGYGGGGLVRLESGLLTLYRPAEKGRVKSVRVPPGKEQVVFELPLDEVLRSRPGADGPWRWDWPRRARAPRSPIHKHLQPGFVERAAFTATVTVGGRAATSNAAVLKVKAAG